MALPAGRYGVTKNQLLKVKKLPMNTIKLIEDIQEEYIPQVVSDAVGWDGDNQIKTPYYQSSISGGINITANDDGSISLSSGKATEREIFYLRYYQENFKPPKGLYKFSKGFTSGAVGLVCEAYNGSTWVKSIGASWSNDEIEINIDYVEYDRLNIYLAVNVNTELTTDITCLPKLTHLTVDEQKADNSVIAPVENGTTASQAYAVREHFIRDGAFCTVTQAISSGGTLTEGTNYTSGDVAGEFGLYIPIANNAGFHNSIFRGKNLGSSVTTAQKTAIANGSFEDLYIGDYWEINSVKWRIAHFDYWYRSGDTQCTTHHVVVVPDSALVNKRMNAKVDNVNTTAGAYVNSEMRTTNLAYAKTIVNAAFGADNILGHREYMQNAVTDGYESAGAWVNADIELMSEIMVYGSNIFHNVKCGTAVPNLYTVNKTQFALFRLDPSFIVCKNVTQTDRSVWWLRDVVSATNFALVSDTGNADGNGASNSYGVRPAFGIK